ncbi:MAG: hypothetical protein ACHQT8_02855 [Chlamydiales bacterium]
MVRKVLKKLKASMQTKSKSTSELPRKGPTLRILTAEGWKRLMLKKRRKG